MIKIATILVNWNNIKDTRECLHSLKAVTYPDHHLILVDNGSSDSSYEILKEEFPHVQHVRSETNLGFAGGNNLGIKIALEQGADAVILLNNDTTVDHDFVASFAAFHEKERSAILGGKIYQYFQKDLIDHLGGYWDPHRLNFRLFGLNESNAQSHLDHPFELDYIVGCCMFIPKKVFEKIGYFDERFFLIWEESDFCTRAKKEGFKNIYVPDVKIYHKGSQSFSGGSSHSSYYWYRNRILWIKKHYSPFDYHKIFLSHILPEWIRMAKHCFFEYIRFGLFKKTETEKKARRNLAALHGGFDHFLGKYGPGPAWISRKKTAHK